MCELGSLRLLCLCFFEVNELLVVIAGCGVAKINQLFTASVANVVAVVV